MAWCDIQNAFLQTTVEERDDWDDQLIVKIRDLSVDTIWSKSKIYEINGQGQCQHENSINPYYQSNISLILIGDTIL